MLIRQVASALAVLHGKDYSHNDVKTDNVLIDVNENGQLEACVTDFGISRMVDASKLQVQSFTLSQIRGASLMYASPEALEWIRHRSHVAANEMRWMVKSDVYSFGVVVAEM